MVLIGSGTKAHTRPDPEKFFPTKIRVTLDVPLISHVPPTHP